MRPDATAPGTVSSVITALALGVLVGMCGTMWHGFIYYFSAEVYLPWGALLGIIMAFTATAWLVLHTLRPWVGGVFGITLFGTVMYAAFGRASAGSVLVFMNTAYPTGVAGVLWNFGSLVAVLVGIAVAARSYSQQRARNPH